MEQYTLNIIPLVMMHRVKDKKVYDETQKAVLAFNAPISLIFDEPDMYGTLDKAVEDMEKIFLCAELGGGGTAHPDHIKITDRGIVNVLRHFKILKDYKKNKESELNTILLDTPNSKSFHLSEDEGMIEHIHPLGTFVKKGEEIAKIYNFKNLKHQPKIYKANCSGIIFSHHFPGLIATGDCLSVIGVEQEL